jgi:hypothetical protein
MLHSSMSPRCASLRFIAWSVLPALLLGPLLGVLHEAEARHRFCSQHGVVEDVADDTTAAFPRGPGGDSAGTRLALRGAGGEPDAGHARCGFHTGTPPRGACIPPLAVATVAPPPIQTAALPEDLPTATTPIVLYAPKTSPPALDWSL